MGKIVLTENVTLDGVTQDPTADEGFNSADWRTDLTAKDREEWAGFILDDTLAADVLLLGRRTYDFFAGRYPSRTGALADAVNGLKKYVVSTTLTDPGWNDSTVLAGLDAVSPLKDTVDGEIRVWGSTELAQGLFERGLVDEVRLLVFPLVLGKGDRLLNRGGDRPWRLVDLRTVGENLALLTYGVAR
jgi:dihydrofolate reductase